MSDGSTEPPLESENAREPSNTARTRLASPVAAGRLPTPGVDWAYPVSVDGRAVALTATEYEILRILSVNAGRVVTSESLLRQAWAGEREPTDTGRVRAFVKQLRAKLGDAAAHPAYIFNERGVGYRMPAPGEE